MARDHANRCLFCGKTSPAEDAHLPKSHKPTCGKRKALERKAAAPGPVDPRVWTFLRDHTDFRGWMKEGAWWSRWSPVSAFSIEYKAREAADCRARARACVREAVEAYR